MREKYEDFILRHVPRILSQIDRNKYSINYGSCDRNYWHLKTRDFSSAILQQTSLTLAILYKNKFDKNIYYNKKIIKELSIASLHYLKKIQLKDGSFNEYYPFEHSFPATSFTLFSSCKTYKILNMNDLNVLQMLKKSAYYLSKKTESLALNQEAASITGLFLYYDLTKDNYIYKCANKKLEKFLSLQNKEGWFNEYDGADIGYLTVTLDMLMELYDLTKNKLVLDSANKIVDFIQYFIHPDGSIGGEYGSRNTMYFLPFGFASISNKGNNLAYSVLNKVLEKSNENNYFLNSIDDRYLAHYIMHSFLRSLSICKENKIEKLPFELEHYNYFEESKLITIKNKNYIIIGANKGGIIKIFNTKEIFIDFGYVINDNKNIYTSSWQNNKNKTTISGFEIEIECYFKKIKQLKMNTRKHAILRIASYFLGSKIIKLLKARIILPSSKSNIKLNRKIIINNDNIKIIDEITSNKKIKNLQRALSLSFRHVASDKFFKETELIDLKDLKYVKGLKKYKFSNTYKLRGE